MANSRIEDDFILQKLAFGTPSSTRKRSGRSILLKSPQAPLKKSERAMLADAVERYRRFHGASAALAKSS
jgi:hypothetical protein